MLSRRVRRLAREQKTRPDEALGWVEETLQRYQENGLLDDGRYAASLARSLRERGASKRAIEQRLIARGVPEGAIASAVAELDGASGHAELDAARRYVRRRGLGPHRSSKSSSRSNDDPEARRRDLASLARAGFDLETARAALELERGDADEF